VFLALLALGLPAPAPAAHPSRPAPTKAELAAGATLFTAHCGPCHSVGEGGIDIMPLTAHLTRLGLEAYIEGQGLVFDHMPAFTGTREERDAIAAYVVAGLHGRVEPAEAAAPLAQLPVTIPPFDSAKDEYVLLTWNTLGMKCITDCDAMYSYLPPGNALGAVVIRRGAKPRMLGDDAVALSYEAPEGFRQPSRHVRYWDFAASISGKALPADTSTAGATLQGPMKWNAKTKVFDAVGIPVVPYSDDGSVNPYPLFTVRATDKATGKELAATQAVVPVGTEMSCWRCHGGTWGRSEGTGVSLETARAILTVHDKRNGTELLAGADAGKPVLCQSCHPDPLFNANVRPELLSLPAALHGFHVNYLKGRGAETCSYCHPDSTAGLTRCLRDSHGKAGMTCTPCHGYLEDHALSLLKKENEKGNARAPLLMRAVSPRLLPDVAAINARTPWLQEPDCLTCHTDGYTRPGADAVAFNTWTADSGGLYRARKEHTGNVPCIACHNSPHATHPSANPLGADRDAVQPLQYQKLNAAIGARGNCVVCHGPDAGLTPEMSPHHPMR
jgi:mono/diheme cytochrome c family protein